ncbi:GNAT family N-acetyltransferase [Nocardioides pelophilus]|uniref:GNAT family N-acetyltransferase n=1 Tax=Nocardioides pelophilus TaxID=2172019 RepID=UPI001601C825|nr:GNAT family N-acetyltransferase [Nocardioides pelophilus]
MSVEILPAVGHYDDFAAVVGSRCLCMAYRNSSLGLDDRRRAMQEECAGEPGPGVLAFVDGEPAGWCSIAPRTSYRRLMRSRTIPHVDDRDPWSAVCFVVRAGFRKRGLMHDLLDGAVAHAATHGAAVVEGYPAEVGDERIDVISGYVGTTRLFEQHGFTRVVETAGHSGHRPRWLMRRDLT